jgi:hypothetical protein
MEQRFSSKGFLWNLVFGIILKIFQCIQILTKTAKLAKPLYVRLTYVYYDLSPWLVFKIGTCVLCEVRTNPEEIVRTIETLRSLWGYNWRWRKCWASDTRDVCRKSPNLSWWYSIVHTFDVPTKSLCVFFWDVLLMILMPEVWCVQISLVFKCG